MAAKMVAAAVGLIFEVLARQRFTEGVSYNTYSIPAVRTRHVWGYVLNMCICHAISASGEIYVPVRLEYF